MIDQTHAKASATTAASFKYGFDDVDDKETVDELRRNCGISGRFLTLSVMKRHDTGHGTNHAENLAEVYRKFILIDLVRMTHANSRSSKQLASDLIACIAGIVSNEPGHTAQGINECRQCLESFELLNLASWASATEVKAAHRDFAKVWHPDRFNDNDERLKRRAEEQFKRVQEAYEHLQSHRTKALKAIS
jgi:hypothetical protein